MKTLIEKNTKKNYQRETSLPLSTAEIKSDLFDDEDASLKSAWLLESDNF